MRTIIVSSIMAWLLAGVVAPAQAPPFSLPPVPGIPEQLPPPTPHELPGETIEMPIDSAAIPVESFDIDPAAFSGMVYPFRTLHIGVGYVHWWISDDELPPLVTFGAAGDGVPGALDREGTRLLFGKEEDGAAVGVRVSASYLLDPLGRKALEANFIYLLRETIHLDPLPRGDFVIARPFLNPNNSENAFVIFSPGLVNGGIEARAETDIFGGEANYRYRWEHKPAVFLSLLGGVRYLQLNDDVHIEERSVAVISVPALRADELTRFDNFSSNNIFFGPQFGLQLECYHERLFLSAHAKLAIGLNHHHVRLDGGTIARNFGAPPFTPVSAGLLVQPTNAGTYNAGSFGLLGEFGVDVGYQLTDHLRVSVGYAYTHWNDTRRAGNQIDRVVNTSQAATTGVPGVLVGAARPAFSFDETDFWMSGFNFTFEFRF